jgi:hypothetical protein
MTILRKALLGGAALAVMTTGAQADELTALKAQLEALQNRVDTMEAAPASWKARACSRLSAARVATPGTLFRRRTQQASTRTAASPLL